MKKSLRICNGLGQKIRILQLQNTKAFVSSLLEEGNIFIACRDAVYFYFQKLIFLNSRGELEFLTDKRTNSQLAAQRKVIKI